MPQHLRSNAPYSTRFLRAFVVLEIGLDRAFELDQKGVAVAVPGLAGGHPDPALADAVFLDIGLFDALEADADVARERVGVIVGAVRIVGEAVGWCVGHGSSLPVQMQGTPDGANVKSASVVPGARAV